MSLNTIFIVCLLIGGSSAAKNSALRIDASNAIGFPEDEENPNTANKQNRKPVYIPATCPENEWYYPGDQKDDWICDCRPVGRPPFIFHPPTDKCWQAFKQGPCAQGQYLILPSNSVIPVCVANPCVVDDYVQWEGKCERLGSTKPCDHMFPVATLGVNATTLVVSCVRVNVESRFGEPTPTPPPSSLAGCPNGGRRNVTGKCV